MDKITSINNQKVKFYSSLNEKKYREKYSLFVVEDLHLINEAYNRNLLDTLIVREDSAIPFEFPNTLIVNEEVIKKISNTTSLNRYLGIVKKPANSTLGSRVFLLDNVQDPGNVGTIIRTACCFGFDTVILSKGCADPFSNKVIRASQGAIFEINIVIADLEKEISELKSKNIPVYATSLHKARYLDEFAAIAKIAIVLGNEGNGVSQEIIDLCDESIKIPIGNFESLNVAIACGIVAYHFRKLD